MCVCVRVGAGVGVGVAVAFLEFAVAIFVVDMCTLSMRSASGDAHISCVIECALFIDSGDGSGDDVAVGDASCTCGYSSCCCLRCRRISFSSCCFCLCCSSCSCVMCCLVDHIIVTGKDRKSVV